MVKYGNGFLDWEGHREVRDKAGNQPKGCSLCEVNRSPTWTLFTPPWQVITWTAGLQLSAWLWTVWTFTLWLRGSSISCFTRRMRTLSTRLACSWTISVGRWYVCITGSEKETKFWEELGLSACKESKMQVWLGKMISSIGKTRLEVVELGWRGVYKEKRQQLA